MNKIAKAREVLKKAFKNDPNFRQTYVDNIACVLLDTDRKITNHKKRNIAADNIVKHIFEDCFYTCDI